MSIHDMHARSHGLDGDTARKEEQKDANGDAHETQDSQKWVGEYDPQGTSLSSSTQSYAPSCGNDNETPAQIDGPVFCIPAQELLRVEQTYL